MEKSLSTVPTVTIPTMMDEHRPVRLMTQFTYCPHNRPQLNITCENVFFPPLLAPFSPPQSPSLFNVRSGRQLAVPPAGEELFFLLFSTRFLLLLTPKRSGVFYQLGPQFFFSFADKKQRKARKVFFLIQFAFARFLLCVFWRKIKIQCSHTSAGVLSP